MQDNFIDMQESCNQVRVIRNLKIYQISPTSDFQHARCSFLCRHATYVDMQLNDVDMQISMLIFNIHLTSLLHINVNKQLIDFTKHYLTPVIHFKTPLPLTSPQKIFQGLRLPDNGNETIKAGNGNPMNLKSRNTEVVHISFCFWISFLLEQNIF